MHLSGTLMFVLSALAISFAGLMGEATEKSYSVIEPIGKLRYNIKGFFDVEQYRRSYLVAREGV